MVYQVKIMAQDQCIGSARDRALAGLSIQMRN